MGRKKKQPELTPDDMYVDDVLLPGPVYTGPTPDPDDLPPIPALPSLSLTQAEHDELVQLHAEIDASYSQFTDRRKRAWLFAYENTCSVGKSDEFAGVSATFHRYWLRRDPEFKKEFDRLREYVGDILELEAFRRAKEGWDEPVYQGGVLVGYIRKYSDTLLIFLLKAAKPEKYRERYDVTTNSSLSINLGVVNELPPGV